MIIEEPIKKIDKEGYSTMCLYNNKILLGDNNKIEILGE